MRMIMTELGGRAALVTGGSRGIVRRLASEGASVACPSAASSTAGKSSQRGRWATSTSIPGSGLLRGDSRLPGGRAAAVPVGGPAAAGAALGQPRTWTGQRRSLRDVPLSRWAAAWRSAPSSSTRKPDQGHDPIRKHRAAHNGQPRIVPAPDMPGERGQRHARSTRYAQPPSLWVSVREPTISAVREWLAATPSD